MGGTFPALLSMLHVKLGSLSAKNSVCLLDFERSRDASLLASRSPHALPQPRGSTAFLHRCLPTYGAGAAEPGHICNERISKGQLRSGNQPARRAGDDQLHPVQSVWASCWHDCEQGDVAVVRGCGCGERRLRRLSTEQQLG